MKRYFCIFLILMMLFPILGCRSNDFENPLTFYYLRKDDNFGSDDSVIASEVIDGSKYTQLQIVLAAYFHGPQDPALTSPFPSGVYLLNAQVHDDFVVVTLSREFATLTGVSLSLASCALAKTIMDFTGAEAVQIQTLATPLDGEASITIHESDILLFDSFTVDATDVTE